MTENQTDALLGDTQTAEPIVSDIASPGEQGAPQPATVDGRLSRRFVTSSMLSRLSMVVVFLIVFALFSVLMPGEFLTVGNLTAMLDSQAVLIVLCIGVTMTLRLGDLDLSFAANMTFCAMVLAILTTQYHVTPILAMILTLGVGALIGAFNAALVVGLGLNGFIVTLGTLTVLGGLTAALGGDQIVTNIPSTIINFAQAHLFGLSISDFYGWIIAAVVWYIYEYTPFGRYLLFAGGNREAARLVGIRVSRVRVTAYVASSTLYAFAGIVVLGTLGAADPTIAGQYLLPPLAGAFLGLTAIQVGRFNVIGAVLGLYLLLMISTGIQLAGASSWVSDVFDGSALIIAIAFAWLLQGRRSSSHFRNPGL